MGQPSVSGNQNTISISMIYALSSSTSTVRPNSIRVLETHYLLLCVHTHTHTHITHKHALAQSYTHRRHTPRHSYGVCGEQKWYLVRARAHTQKNNLWRRYSCGIDDPLMNHEFVFPVCKPKQMTDDYWQRRRQRCILFHCACNFNNGLF